MLILSRKKGEALLIDGRIRIVITNIEHDRVKVGIEAPPEVIVWREEVAERIKREGQP